MSTLDFVIPRFYCVGYESESQVLEYDEGSISTFIMVMMCHFQLGWSPRRLGLLACLCKDSTSIRIFDIQHTPSVQQEYELSYKERTVECKNYNLYFTLDLWSFRIDFMGNLVLTAIADKEQMQKRFEFDYVPCPVLY